MAGHRPESSLENWWRYGVSYVGTLLLVVGITTVVLDGQVTGDRLIQLSTLVVLSLMLIAVGTRIALEVSAGHQLGRVLGWTGIGVIIMAILGLWWGFVLDRTVGTGFEAALVFLSVLSAGALFGAIVGYYEVRVRRLVDRASREAARREFLDEQQDTLSSLNRIFRHQILNDLSVISGRSELLAADEIDRERATESINAHCESMVETVKRLETLIDVLTHVSDSTDVPVQSALVEARRRARERVPELEVETAGATDATVRADELLPLALAELFVNAGEHGDGVASVTVSERSESVVIEVADDGPGINLTPVESAFEPNVRDPESEGEGLGLFLATLVVDRYGGDIRIVETDGGTTVEVEIPTPTSFLSESNSISRGYRTSS